MFDFGEIPTDHFTSVTNSNDALRVSIPCNIVDPAGDNRICALCIDAFNRIPNHDYARGIARSHIVAGRGETGDGSSIGVVVVLFTGRRVVNRPQKD